MGTADELRAILHDSRKEAATAVMRLERLEVMVMRGSEGHAMDRALEGAHKVKEASRELRCVVDGLVEPESEDWTPRRVGRKDAARF